MELPIQRRAKIAAILASLLVHGMLVHVMFTQWLDTSNLTPPITLDDQKQQASSPDADVSLQNNVASLQQPEEWVMLTAGQGSDTANAASVLFWDEPIADDLQENDDHTPKESADDDAQEELSAMQLPNDDQAADDTHLTQEVPAQADNSASAPQESAKEESLTTCASEISRALTALPITQNAPPRKKRPRKAKAAQSQFTLADLARGFVTQMPEMGRFGQSGGNYDANMQGTRTGKATAKQIMTRHYLEKIFVCIQNSFRVNKNKFPLSSFDRSPQPTSVAMTLDKKGAIVDLRIVESSSNGDLDRFLLFVFKDATGTYPCIPDALDVTICPVVYNNVLGLLQNSFSAATISLMPAY